MSDKVPMTAQQAVNLIATNYTNGPKLAADVYREYIKGGGTEEELRNLAPHIPMKVWTLIRYIAEYRLTELAALIPQDIIINSLLKYSIADQEKIIISGVDFLIVDRVNSVNTTVIKRFINKMDIFERNQVFGKTEIRNQQEQRKWLDDRFAKNTPTKQIRIPRKLKPPYHIDHTGNLVINKACTLTPSEVKNIYTTISKMGKV